MAEKTRYTDEELEEFREIINEKLALAKRDYDQMMKVLMNEDSNDVDDTSPTTRPWRRVVPPSRKRNSSQWQPVSRSSSRD